MVMVGEHLKTIFFLLILFHLFYACCLVIYVLVIFCSSGVFCVSWELYFFVIYFCHLNKKRVLKKKFGKF